MGVQPRATTPLKELSVQHTGCAVQLVPLTPMTEMGEQPTPTWPVRLPTTMPSRPSRDATEGEDADWTELQHCCEPTLHWAIAVAAARMGTSAKTLLNNIVCLRERD